MKKLPTPRAFDPNSWYIGPKKSKTDTRKSSSGETSMSDDVGESMSALNKLIIGGTVATIGLGLAGAFTGMFKK